MTVSVYRLRDAQGCLLYVGCSREPGKRIGVHRRKPWGSEIATVEVDEYPDRPTAAQVEYEFMQAEQPPHNRVLRFDRRDRDRWGPNSARGAQIRKRLADLLLGGKLDEFVRSRRAEGRAWRLIARDLWEATDGALDVTHETLRSWYPEDRRG